MRLGVFALVFAATGCYSFTRLDTGEVSPTQVVRVELSDAGRTSITPALGTSVEFVEGRVVEASDASVTLSVDGVRRRGDPTFKEWPGDSVRLAKGDIRELSLKRQDRSKTTAAIVGGATAAIAIVVMAARATGLLSGSGGKTVPVPAVR